MPAVDSSVDPNTKLYRELFIGNTTPDMNEVELMEFLGAAMQQVGLTIKPGNPILSVRLSGKFAFVEVRSMEETNNALNMNGIPYMGQNLRVGRPTKYTGPSVPHLEWPELLAKYMAGDLTQTPLPPEMAALQQQGSSCVLKLGNMVTPEDLADDEEYKEIIEDTKEECSKFGHVVSVVIPRSLHEPGNGKVFVEFSSSEAAFNAAKVLSGRTFDGKQVEATFYDEKAYAEENYSL
jgi:splicing factor U2AF subunit